MNRRELLFFLGSAVTAPGELRAQQKAMPVIGSSGSPRPARLHPIWPHSAKG
jgi:hypothetical protein